MTRPPAAGSPGRGGLPRVTLLTRPGCTLCDKAAAIIRRVAEDVPLTFETVDIDADPALRARYTNVIPVVRIDGEDALVSKISEVRLRRALARPASGGGRASRD